MFPHRGKSSCLRYGSPALTQLPHREMVMMALRRLRQVFRGLTKELAADTVPVRNLVSVQEVLGMVKQTVNDSAQRAAGHVLDVLNPVARIAEGKVAPAPRTADLTGKTVGLYWNQKPGGDVTLAAVARELESRFRGLQFRRFTYPFPTASDDLASVVNGGVDAVVGSSAT